MWSKKNNYLFLLDTDMNNNNGVQTTMETNRSVKVVPRCGSGSSVLGHESEGFCSLSV